MTDALHFSLVSPERELYTGTAARVQVPGTEGLFEVGPNHAPLMSTLAPGMVTITKDAGSERYFVRGGFADVTAQGLTVLAEVAIPEGELSGPVLGAEKDLAAKALAREDLGAEDRLNAQRAADVLSAF